MDSFKESLAPVNGWRNLAKKMVCGACAAGMMVALVPSGAFASDIMGAYYELPKANQAIAFDHDANDNGNDYTYRHVTIGASGAPMAATYYEFVGLNYTANSRAVNSIFSSMTDGVGTKNESYTQGEVGNLSSRQSTLAIIGSDNNENPDEYVWNFCVWANGGAVAADSMVNLTNINATSAVSVTIDGATYSNFPREIYTECDIIGQDDSSALYEEKSYLEWIALENQREGRPKKGTYDPYFAKYGVVSGGGAAMVRGLYALAEVADEVVAASVDENGNYTLQTRYGGNRPDGTVSMLNDYEDIVQATQYYTMSKIADGTVKEAVTAVLVGYDPATGNYAVRKYTGSEPNSNRYGGRVANYACSISKSITDLGLEPAQAVTNEAEEPYVVWYTPEQIVANADACFVCDAPSTNRVSNYLAAASDGACYTVYTPPTNDGKEEEDNTEDLQNARKEAVSAGRPHANFCFSYPANMFNNFYAQGVENGMLAAITTSFTYPELYNLTDMLGYWVKNVWHIKDSRVQSILSAATAEMSLSGSSIGTLSENYEENAQAILDEGNLYYLNNYEKINALNEGNLKTYDMTALRSRMYDNVKKDLEDAKSSSDRDAKRISELEAEVAKLRADLAAAKSSGNASKTSNNSVKEVTVNTKTVTAKSLASAIRKAGGNVNTVTSVTLGKKVKSIKKNAFKGTGVKTVIVKTKKLTRKSIKGSLKGSKVKTVQVKVGSKAANKKVVKKYKKIFTKKNAGKKATVK